MRTSPGSPTVAWGDRLASTDPSVRSIAGLPVGRPAVMGVINLTPDSFSDGGAYNAVDRAVTHARELVAAGADLLDLGAESTRPGSERVSEDAERDRLLPVLRAVRDAVEVPVSVDTYKPGIMREAVAAGAAMINDVFALRQPGALEAAAELQVPICLMHMLGDDPATMQENPAYDDVVREVIDFLAERAQAAQQAGVPGERIVLDPGFGFGKRTTHNYLLLRHLDRLNALGYPVLAGMSRKSMIGRITGRSVDERAVGSAVVAALAVFQGAAIVRAHDVEDTRDAVRLAEAARDPDRVASLLVDPE